MFNNIQDYHIHIVLRRSYIYLQFVILQSKAYSDLACLVTLFIGVIFTNTTSGLSQIPYS